MAFTKAVKTSAKLRLALSGPAGAGKTYTALKLATELADGKPIAVLDTERGSASKYADEFEFDTMQLTNFHPHNYVEAINDAARGGYGVIVVDSLSHAWYGTGGLLELVSGNFNNWAKVKPIENKLLDTIIGAPIHVIVTMRSKAEYVVEKNEATGKSEPRKVGTSPIQRDGIEYEFDVFGELDVQNTLSIRKTRCSALNGAVIPRPGREMVDTLRTWLSGAPAPARTMPAADDERKVVAPQIAADRARLQAEPTPETPFTYTVEETQPEPIQINVVDEIRKLVTALNLTPSDWKGIKHDYKGRPNEMLLAYLQELNDAKADGFPLDRPAKKAQ